MILLLGGSGYVGSAFRELLARGGVAHRSVSRRECDYTRVEPLAALIRDAKATFLINAAGYTGKPNVDACERDKAACLAGNAVLPGVIREACERTSLPWGHVSSGCIYTGARDDGGGFTEDDPPNFSFRTDNCSFYSGTKALGEECLAGAKDVFLWRLRIQFDHVDSPRNYLSKLQRYRRLLDARNSISHLGEFVAAAWACWERRVPFGTYNVTNTGSVTTREVVALIRQRLLPDHAFDFFESEEEFLRVAAQTPRSNCVMDNSKLRATGVPISEVHDAIERALAAWRSA
ncbi:MAG: sugar nucleotide-binding protein [Planctomycetaceae bacterium]